MSAIQYSHTLWSPSDTVKDVAEILGITNLPDEVAKSLAMDIEYRITEIIEQALKFMKHSKRTILTTSDISYALRVLNVESLYGHETGRPLKFKEAMVGPGQTLYYTEDQVVDFEKLINQPLPRVPHEVTFTAHWLAIEGTQPAISQNILPSQLQDIPPPVRGSTVSHSISAIGDDLDVKAKVKHVVSKELQLYFNRATEALLGQDSSLRAPAVASLKNDPGLHQLVPYLVQFVKEKVTCSLRSDAQILNTMLQVVDALLSNPTIFMEPYIHIVLPAVLTPMLAKHVASEDPEGDPLATYIRDHAASLLKKISQTFGSTYFTLRPRVTRSLLRAFLDTTRPAGALYGAIVGAECMGSEVVRVIILGNVKVWVEAAFSRVSHDESEILSTALLRALKTLVSETDDPKTDYANIDTSTKQQLEDLLGSTMAGKVLACPDASSLVTMLLLDAKVYKNQELSADFAESKTEPAS